MGVMREAESKITDNTW